jgi:hypothetical protein
MVKLSSSSSTVPSSITLLYSELLEDGINSAIAFRCLDILLHASVALAPLLLF